MPDGVRIDRSTRTDEFLAKAEGAERMALEAKDERLRESWRKIARGYRDLAGAIIAPATRFL